MDNGWYESEALGNKNVPKNTKHEKHEVFGSLVTMSGEIITTYYITYYKPSHPDYGNWAHWKVGSWKGDEPELFEYREVANLRWRKSN